MRHLPPLENCNDEKYAVISDFKHGDDRKATTESQPTIYDEKTVGKGKYEKTQWGKTKYQKTLRGKAKHQNIQWGKAKHQNIQWGKAIR